MFRMVRAGAAALALALLGVLSMGLLTGAHRVSAAPPAQEKTELVGTIHVMALDNVGGGYAWADVRRHGGGGGQAPSTGSAHMAAPVQASAQATPEPYSLLLRIERQ